MPALKFLYHWLVMPLGLALLGLAAMALYARRTNNPLRRPLAALFILLYALSTRPGAALLCRPLESAVTPPAIGEAAEADVILMLGAGSVGGVPDFEDEGQPSAVMAKNILAAFRLQRATGLPLLVSGGSPYRERAAESGIAGRVLLGMGVPEDRLFREEESRNTVENIRFSKAVMERHGWRRALLVCPALHAPRAAAICRREGLDCLVWPSHYRMSARDGFAVMPDLAPQSCELDNSAMAIREYAGRLAVALGLQ